MNGGRWISLSQSFLSWNVWNLEVSISSRIMRFVFKISLFLLEIGKKLQISWSFCKNSHSFLEPENRSRHFSFSQFHFLASRQCQIQLNIFLKTIIKYWRNIASCRHRWSFKNEAVLHAWLHMILNGTIPCRKNFYQL